MLIERVPNTFPRVFASKVGEKGEFDLEVFKSPEVESNDIYERLEVMDKANPDIKQMIDIMSPLLIYYLAEGSLWDITELAEIILAYSNYTTLISGPNSEVVAAYNTMVEQSSENTTISTNSIMVHPQYRGQHFATAMLDQITENYSPLLISGHTNYGVAALSRARILARKKYATFFGGKVIGGEQYTDNEKILKILSDKLREKSYRSSAGVYVQSVPYGEFKEAAWPQKKPQTMSENEWGNLQFVLRVLDVEQLSLRDTNGNKVALVQAPLISIKVTE